MSLFDVIRGSLYLLGGMREADIAEKDVESQIATRKGSLDVARERTTAEKESAAAQRDLTEKLTRGGWEHQTSEREASQAFQVKLTDLDIKTRIGLQASAQDAAYELEKYKGSTEIERQAMENQSRERIAALQALLQRQGLTIEMEKLKKMMPWQVEFMMKAAMTVLPQVLGESGLWQSYTNKKGMTQGNMDVAQSLINSLVEQIDPSGKMGLKGMQIPKIIVGPQVPLASPEMPIGGPSLVPSHPQSPTPIMPSIPGPRSQAPSPIDQTAITSSRSLHPQDDYKLQLWSSAIKGFPAEHQGPALEEYNQILANEPFAGMADSSDEAYRALVRSELYRKVNPYSFSGR